MRIENSEELKQLQKDLSALNKGKTIEQVQKEILDGIAGSFKMACDIIVEFFRWRNRK